MMKYEVSTTLTNDGKIFQGVDFVSGGIRERLTQSIIDTKEEQFKDALIKLGWTPPIQSKPSTDTEIKEGAE